jgi:hypothetical protein
LKLEYDEPLSNFPFIFNLRRYNPGFASGDCERDAAAIRIFVDDGHKAGLAPSGCE